MNKNITKKTIVGFALISFLAGIAGLIVSSLNLKEDILSTAHTVFDYFPKRYNVIPASTWEGAQVLGVFTTVTQIVASSIMLSKEFSKEWRISALVTFLLACYFDNWTDVIHRSSDLTGNIPVAILTTIAFYTGGSELLQGFSLMLIGTTWRKAISDLMWGVANFISGMLSIGAEWKKFYNAAIRKERKARDEYMSSESGRNDTISALPVTRPYGGGGSRPHQNNTVNKPPIQGHKPTTFSPAGGAGGLATKPKFTKPETSETRRPASGYPTDPDEFEAFLMNKSTVKLVNLNDADDQNN